MLDGKKNTISTKDNVDLDVDCGRDLTSATALEILVYSKSQWEANTLTTPVASLAATPKGDPTAGIMTASTGGTTFPSEGYYILRAKALFAGRAAYGSPSELFVTRS